MSAKSQNPWNWSLALRITAFGLAASFLLAGAFGGEGQLEDQMPADTISEFEAPPDNDAAPFQRGARPRGGDGVYKAQITPHWFPQDAGFWYRNDLPRGATEYVVVDTAASTRGPAFDHARLAEALGKAAVADVQADKLPLSDLEFDRQAGKILFRAGGTDWRCDLKTYELSKVEGRKAAAADRLSPLDARNAPRASTRTGSETSLTFSNK